MATPLKFHFQGEDWACHLSKVERSHLYGYVEREVLDEREEPCSLATLGPDGKTLIGPGGMTFAYFDPDGHWCDRSELEAVDEQERPVSPMASSFKAPVELGVEATVEEYLSHNVRLVYALDVSESLPAGLEKALGGGTIFQFPFSYRGGLEPDQGFLFRGQDETLWLVLGRRAEIQMIGLAEAGAAVEDFGEEPSGAEDGDLFDFGQL